MLGTLTREGRLEAGALQEALALLPPLLGTAQRMEARYSQKIESVDRLQRDAVVEVHDSLEAPDAAVDAITVVALELMRLLTAAGNEKLLEAAAIRHARQRDAGAGDGVVAGLNAVALRTRIEGDLATWAALPPVEEGCEEVPEERRQGFDRLERSKAAYRTVSEWLNETRTAQANGRGIEDLRHARQKLFATYRELAKVIQAGPLATPDATIGAGPDPETQERLREEIEQAARVGAEVDAEKEANQQAIRDAASNSARPSAIPTVPKRQRSPADAGAVKNRGAELIAPTVTD